MKKTLLLFVSMLCAGPIFAQDSTALSTKANAWIDKPDVIIKGEELKNFPSSRLLEMLVGRIPGFDFTPGGDTRFLYVVDGMIWKNINAININDVEEIAFYRGGLTGKFGVNNAPAGVILITTKSAAFNQPLTVNVNAQAGIGYIKYPEREKIHPQSYHVAISQGLDKFSWRTSATYSNDFSDYEAFDRDRKLQLNGDLRFEPLKWISIGAGVNYAPASLQTSQTEYRVPGMRDATYKNTVDNWNGFFTVKAQPIKGLVNEFRIRYDRLKLNEDNTFIYNLPPELMYLGMNKETYLKKDDNFYLLNNLNYTISADQDRIKFKVSAIFQYNLQKFKSENDRFYPESPYIGSKTLLSHHAYSRSPGHNLMGEGSLDLYNILSIQGGVSRDTFNGITSRAYYSPYLAASLNLKDVALKDAEFVNELSLVASYSRYRSDIYNPNGGVAYYPYNGNKEEDDKMKMRTYGLRTSFFNNRLQLSADWQKENTYNYSLRNYFDSYLLITMNSKRTGWRVWSSADILRNTSFKWNAGLSMYESKNDLSFQDEVHKAFFVNEHDTNSGTQFGMQQKFSYHEFSLNVNGYALIKKTKPFTTEKANHFNLNYASLGYDFKGKNTLAGFKDLNVSVFGRNLLQHNKVFEYIDSYRRIGLAVNARF